MIVRDAHPGDEAAIARVVASGISRLRLTYRPTAAAVRRKRSLPRLVALDGDALVGTVEYQRGVQRIHLVGLYVDEAHRRRGVARHLVEALAERAAGADRMSLYTLRETGNVAIFERLGFVACAEELARDYVSDRHTSLTEVYMERALTAPRRR